MPVTRSQNKQNKEVVTVTGDQKLTKWFYSIMHKYLDEITLLNDKKYNNRDKFYDMIRIVTEKYYIIRNYFPELYSKNQDISAGFINFAKVVYDKISLLISVFYSISQEESLPHDIFDDINEYNSIKNMFKELHATEKMLISYLDDEPRKPKRSPYVSYIGMDTMTDDIKDLDYNPEYKNKNKVEDEDEDEDYIPDDEDDDEDYIPDENEIFDCLLKSKNLPSQEELSKPIKNEKNIWFDYDYY